MDNLDAIRGLLDMLIPPVTAAVAYVYKKIHDNEKTISVVKAELEDFKETALQRHSETLELQKEQRADIKTLLSMVRNS